jgi:chromate transport protein ChrA
MWWLIGVLISAFISIIVLTVLYQKFSDDYEFRASFPFLCFLAIVLAVFWPITYPAAIFITASVFLGKWIAKKWFVKEQNDVR